MKTLTSFLIAGSILLSAPVFAASSKHVTYSIDVASFTDVQMEMSIGEMDIEIYDGESIELEIELIAERRWFSLRRDDVDDIELEQRERGDSLYLGIDDDDLHQTWVVRMPAHLALEIDLGVGEVEISDLENSLKLELGVGAVQVDVANTNYGEIVATAGVGDAVIRGIGQGTDNERSMLVGADAYYYGDGEHTIEVEVGVGDARIRAR